MSKLNSKMYKNKMLEENKKSENSSDQIQVRLSQFRLSSRLTCIQENPGGGSEDSGVEKMLPGL